VTEIQENIETLPQCTDMPLFADCTLLINVKHFNPDSYCNDNYYYSKFCCKSCTEAGLPLHEAFLKTMGEEFNENYQIKLAERNEVTGETDSDETINIEYEPEYEY